MLENIISQPIFGFSLCVGAYNIALSVKRRFNYTLLNPLLVGSLIVIAILSIFKIPLESFLTGANFVSMFLGPATAALAISMYNQLDTIKKNLIPILVGSVVGAASAVASILLLCKIFDLDAEMTASLLPKSITTAFGTELSKQLGGIVPITVAAISTTGIFGAITAPYLIKLFKIKNPVASGLAIGASSHVLGTSKAIELGEVEGSVSSIAVGLCGIITVIIAIFVRF